MAKIKPSKFQLDIYDAYNKTNSNLVISAVAGSGKTTTILELLNFVPYHKKVIFLAFNKSIVDELTNRAPSGVEVSTLHSLGCKALYRHYKGKVEVNDYKNYRIAKQLSRKWKNIPPNKIDAYMFNLSKIVNYYKLTLQKSHSAIQSIIDFYGIETIGDEVIHTSELLDALDRYNENPFEKGDSKFMIDFSDMVYLPAVDSKIKMNTYNEVFVDESQDMNAAQQLLVKKILSKDGRFIAVGDPKQAIYGFMGSDVNAYNNFKDQPNTIELPLSVCYRCGTEIVKKANEVYNIMESPEGHFEGEVVLENGNFDDIKPGDFVICRNNKPLVQLYFDFIKAEIPCYIKGADVGKGIINLIKSLDHNKSKEGMLQDLKIKLSEIYVELQERKVQNPIAHPKYQSFLEKMEIIEIIAKKYSTVETIVSAIERIFKESGKGVVLQTVHKSKGCEAENVYFYQSFLIPSKYAESIYEKIQERNLLYVGITRAKKRLIFVDMF